jgi:acetyltransferase-like isoleucine patch superfamily enzyme
VVGNHVMLGAGTKLANFKLNATEIIVRAGGAEYATGLDKFGAIVGDGCKFGCNSVSHPGTIFGKGCVLLPCTTARGCVPAGTMIQGRLSNGS